MLAALSKRAFAMQDQSQELVNCVHRTVAEYLGACYLVKLIRGGLSIERVRSWLEVEGCPASELRGLYAWLTQLLPESTNVLLKSDPYGVLVYGDVSCLTSSSRKALFQALINLAKKDPWFHAQDWNSTPLGALSTADMANDFKTILSSQREQFHLCSLVLDVIKHGEPQPELENILLEIFCDEKRYYAERSRAFECLLHAVPDGKNLAVKATKERLEISADSLRLKAGVLAKLYQNNFNVHDVIQFINDYSQFNSKQISSGDLWYIGESLPIDELIKILDSLAKIKLNKGSEAVYEVSVFFSDILTRVLNYITTIEPERLWLWLSGVQKYRDPSYNYHHQKDDPVRNWLLKNKPYVFQMFENTLADASINELCALLPFWQNFQNTVRYVLDDSEIIPIAFSFIEKKEKCNDKERAIFKLIFCLTIDLNPPDIELFNQLKNYGDLHPELAEILEYNCFCTIDDWRHDDRVRKIENKQKSEETQYKNRRDFKHNINLIRTAQHLNWLGWLAKVFFAKFSDIDNTQTPRERLAEQLGEENVEAALEGLCAITNRIDLPKPIELVNQYLQDTGSAWWLAILAGITESYHAKADLNTYSEPLLRSSLAIDLLYPIYYLQEKQGSRKAKFTWQQDLFQLKPSLVQSVYLEIIEVQLQAKNKSIQGLREICETPELKNNRAEVVLKLLANYPNMDPQDLKILLLTAITFPEHKIAFIELVESALNTRARVRLNRRELWLSAGFIISFETFKDRITGCIAKHNSVIWVLISIVESVRLEGDKMQALELSIAQRVFLIHLVGEYFPDIERTDGTLIGNQNPWDAAKFVQGQITTLSTFINSEASTALTWLIKETKLSSYRDYFKHAAAN